SWVLGLRSWVLGNDNTEPGAVATGWSWESRSNARTGSGSDRVVLGITFQRPTRSLPLLALSFFLGFSRRNLSVLCGSAVKLSSKAALQRTLRLRRESPKGASEIQTAAYRTSGRQQIAEPKGFALHHFTFEEANRLTKVRTIDNKGVELSIFTTRINVCGQRGQKLSINRLANK